MLTVGSDSSPSCLDHCTCEMKHEVEIIMIMTLWHSKIDIKNIIIVLIALNQYNITRNELASLAHSFYTCLKHQLIHLTIVLLRSIHLGFIAHGVVIYSTRYFILSKNSR